MRRLITLLALFALLGCDRFVDASEEECGQVADHAQRLQAKSAVGDNLAGDLAGKLLKEVGDKTGLRKDAIAQCRGWMKKSDVRCYLKADTVEEAKACKR